MYKALLDHLVLLVFPVKLVILEQVEIVVQLEFRESQVLVMAILEQPERLVLRGQLGLLEIKDKLGHKATLGLEGQMGQLVNQVMLVYLGQVEQWVLQVGQVRRVLQVRQEILEQLEFQDWTATRDQQDRLDLTVNKE